MPSKRQQARLNKALKSQGQGKRADVNEDGLNIREAKFVQRLLIHNNQARAAREAGFSGSATQRGYELIRRPKVRAVLERERAKVARKYAVTAERVIEELARLSFSDLKAMYDDEGQLIPITDLPDSVSPAIAQVEQYEEYSGRGEDREPVGHVRKYKLADKGYALKLLCQHLKLLGGEGSGQKDRLQEVVDALRGNTEVKKEK